MGLAESRFFRLIAYRTMGSPAGLKPIPPVSRISSSIVRILGCNPGPMTLQGTNTYLLGTGSERILIDTGEKNNSEYLDHLTTVLAEEKARISQIVITHWHYDHTGGLHGVLGSQYIAPDARVIKIKRGKADETPPDVRYTFIEHGDSVNGEGVSLRAIHTPGHTDDHMSLFLEEDRAIFSGDCILGEGTALMIIGRLLRTVDNVARRVDKEMVFEEFATYLRSLRALKDLNPAVIYPAHGSVIDNPVEVIQRYIEHRMEREKQILSSLKGAYPEGLTIDKLVSAIYPTLNMILRKGAANNVKQQLEKLITDGRVAKDGSGFKLLPDEDQSPHPGVHAVL